jgi:hypothetical protein
MDGRVYAALYRLRCASNAAVRFELEYRRSTILRSPALLRELRMAGRPTQFTGGWLLNHTQRTASEGWCGLFGSSSPSLTRANAEA